MSASIEEWIAALNHPHRMTIAERIRYYVCDRQIEIPERMMSWSWVLILVIIFLSVLFGWRY